MVTAPVTACHGVLQRVAGFAAGAKSLKYFRKKKKAMSTPEIDLPLYIQSPGGKIAKSTHARHGKNSAPK
jgi:hypothetical protein